MFTRYDTTKKLWFDPQNWPRDARGYTFLADAVLAVGKALFDEEWSAEDTRLVSPLNLAQVSSLLGKTDARQRAAVRSLLEQEGLREAPRTANDLVSFSDEEWAKGIELANELDGILIPARERLDAVTNTLCEHFLDGGVRTAVRPIEGGDFTGPLSAKYWNIDDPTHRFHSCQLDPKSPFGKGVSGDGYMYIFVDMNDLSRLVARLKGEEPEIKPESFEQAGIESLYLSPYMQLAFDAIRHHGITETHHDTKVAIKAWLTAAGKARGLYLSDRDTDAIATVIRHPDAKKGKANK